MRKSLFIVLSCAFLITQGVSYKFDINTKYGKLQQECIKNIRKSCRAMWEGCHTKRIGNACEAQYSLGIALITNAMFVERDLENGMFEFGVIESGYGTVNYKIYFYNGEQPTAEVSYEFYNYFRMEPPEVIGNHDLKKDEVPSARDLKLIDIRTFKEW